MNPQDQAAVVAYDDHVNLIAALGPASERVARQVMQLSPGGSTNLYGGWLEGAKQVGRGGRVVLLSDGWANAGRAKSSDELAIHARTSYQRFGVTTTTIGIGEAYDEALMAGMAREGGGNHYFASDCAAVERAFSQEQYSSEATVLRKVSFRYQGQTVQLGQFWAGESRAHVLTVRELGGDPMTLRFIDPVSKEERTVALHMPSEFGYSSDVQLASLVQQASDLEYEMVRVRNERAAGEMHERLRLLTLLFLSHPRSDDQEVRLIIERLNASLVRLQGLRERYDEREANLHRKRSSQMSANLREPDKAFAEDEAQRQTALRIARSKAGSVQREDLQVDPGALALAPLERWRSWKAIPIRVTRDQVEVAMLDPRQGFVLKDIEMTLKLRVIARFAEVDELEIDGILDNALTK